MTLDFRFAVVSDLHVALPHTVWDHPARLHLVEVAVPVLEIILRRLSQLDLDFLLLPGDLTQHGEPENHAWLAQRLAQLPYPVYVIPGNHDVPSLKTNTQSIGFEEFPHYYRQFGYANTDQHYYTQELIPGVRLIALNSNTFDAEGRQVGYLDPVQLAWLRSTLWDSGGEVVLVMIHHNVIEHMPDQRRDRLGQRYILENAPELLEILRQAEVQLIFTGHLHVQHIAHQDGIYDITTGSLVSFPHPYRVLHFHPDQMGRPCLQIESDRILAVPGWDYLAEFSRNLMGDRSHPYMLELLTQPPLNLSPRKARRLAPQLRNFWADFASGDAQFDFPDFPEPVRQHFERFSSKQPGDNSATLWLSSPKPAGAHPVESVPGSWQAVVP
jgi:3',5'-cyclic AMP phosphodiesterase CpdA